MMLKIDNIKKYIDEHKDSKYVCAVKSTTIEVQQVTCKLVSLNVVVKKGFEAVEQARRGKFNSHNVK